jgi:hypothetical protein
MTRALDLVIVGAQKAGTTSLKEYLGQHPEVSTHREREMTYFVSDREFAEGYAAAFERYFPAVDGATRCLLAKSVGIMFHPPALERLAAHDRAVKAIAVLRNPVDRAYSAFWFCRRLGWEKEESFEAGLAAEPARAITPDSFRHTAYVGRGEYASQIERLYARLGRDRVGVILFEDLVANPAEVCRAVFEFAGVAPDFTPDHTPRENRAGDARSPMLARALANEGLKRVIRAALPQRLRRALKERLRALNDAPFMPPPMDPATRARLIATFAPANDRLAGLLGRDLSGWNR